MKSIEKDILLICKGWYNKERYSSVLGALNGYYHKNYSGCEDVIMDKRFAINLFLKPLFIFLLPFRLQSIFEPSCLEVLPKYDRTFENVMFDRLVVIISGTDCKVAEIDLSDYQDMFDKAKECGYDDETIGII